MLCGDAVGKFIYMRRCRGQVHVYAALPLASLCICGNAAGKFMYMWQRCWQVHIYAAMPAGKFMYMRQCRSQPCDIHFLEQRLRYRVPYNVAAFSLAAMPHFMAAMPHGCERQCRMNEGG